MKKRISKILAVIALVAAVIAGIAYMYLLSLKPVYSGEQQLQGLAKTVDVYFDDYGIPHIFAESEEDAYFALGYVKARERLFQMELIRRIAGGRLSEFAGRETLKTDVFFRALGLEEYAAASAEKYMSGNDLPYQRAAQAYVDGINQYIETGSTPIEFTILGIPKTPFTMKDLYLVSSFTAFGFTWAFRTDPTVEFIARNYGAAYLQDLQLDWMPGAQKIPVHKPDDDRLAAGMAKAAGEIMNNLPVPVWLGSNSWVIGPRHTASGKVILANDTHMLFSQPSPWYEAHLEYPGFNHYGFYLAGFPFAMVGNNQYCAIGMTMFPGDDMDFFRETLNPENPSQVLANGEWQALELREETIRIDGHPDTTFQVRSTPRGPIISDAFEAISKIESQPVSQWWTMRKILNQGLEAAYKMNHAASIDEVREAVSLIHAPGINVMYGDRDNNIAWWAVSRLLKRPENVNSKVILDGKDQQMDPLGFYEFRENPSAENPPQGFVFSANNQPDSIDGRLYPGYYAPENRAQRIVEYLSSGKKWDVATVQDMQLDVVSTVYADVAAEIITSIETEAVVAKSPNHQKAADLLKNWNGDHQLEDIAPTIYYRMLFQILNTAMGDELGDERLRTYMFTHLIKKSFPKLIKNSTSPWWDDVETADRAENRREILANCFDATILDLEDELGKDISEWKWGRVHTLEHPHMLGKVKPLDRIFNVGKFSVVGGDETINPATFMLSDECAFSVAAGPSMRMIIDFADLENSVSVNVTGQSGNFLSPHYGDQAELFNNGLYRKRITNRQAIMDSAPNKLVLIPE